MLLEVCILLLLLLKLELTQKLLPTLVLHIFISTYFFTLTISLKNILCQIVPGEGCPARLEGVGAAEVDGHAETTVCCTPQSTGSAGET